MGRGDGSNSGLGQRLKQARVGAGLTQRQAGQAIGVDPNTIYSYETDRVNPSGPALHSLAHAYDKHYEWFFGEGDQRQPEPESKAEQLPIEADRELVMNEASLALRSTGKELSDEAIRSIADFIRFVHEKERRESQSGS